MSIKKILLGVLSTIVLTACGANAPVKDQAEKVEHVKVAVVGSASHEIWDYVAEKAKKENIEIEVLELNDYVQPNKQLADGEVHLNAFQHRAYLKKWNEEHGTDIKEIGTTFIVPLYFFSTKIKSLSDLPENGKVSIPKETAIQGRALVALQTAGVIKLKDGGSTTSSVDDIVENPKNIEFVEIESAQAARTLEDVDAGTVGGTFAKDAGMDVNSYIFTDVAYLDTIPNDRFNIIAANGKDVDNPVYKKIVELFQQQDVADKMNEISPGQFFPVWDKK